MDRKRPYESEIIDDDVQKKKRKESEDSDSDCSGTSTIPEALYKDEGSCISDTSGTLSRIKSEPLDYDQHISNFQQSVTEHSISKENNYVHKNNSLLTSHALIKKEHVEFESCENLNISAKCDVGETQLSDENDIAIVYEHLPSKNSNNKFPNHHKDIKVEPPDEREVIIINTVIPARKIRNRSQSIVIKEEPVEVVEPVQSTIKILSAGSLNSNEQFLFIKKEPDNNGRCSVDLSVDSNATTSLLDSESNFLVKQEPENEVTDACEVNSLVTGNGTASVNNSIELFSDMIVKKEPVNVEEIINSKNKVTDAFEVNSLVTGNGTASVNNSIEHFSDVIVKKEPVNVEEIINSENEVTDASEVNSLVTGNGTASVNNSIEHFSDMIVKIEPVNVEEIINSENEVTDASGVNSLVTGNGTASVNNSIDHFSDMIAKKEPINVEEIINSENEVTDASEVNSLVIGNGTASVNNSIEHFSDMIVKKEPINVEEIMNSERQPHFGRIVTETNHSDADILMKQESNRKTPKKCHEEMSTERKDVMNKKKLYKKNVILKNNILMKFLNVNTHINPAEIRECLNYFQTFQNPIQTRFSFLHNSNENSETLHTTLSHLVIDKQENRINSMSQANNFSELSLPIQSIEVKQNSDPMFHSYSSISSVANETEKASSGTSPSKEELENILLSSMQPKKVQMEPGGFELLQYGTSNKIKQRKHSLFEKNGFQVSSSSSSSSSHSKTLDVQSQQQLVPLKSNNIHLNPKFFLDKSFLPVPPNCPPVPTSTNMYNPKQNISPCLIPPVNAKSVPEQNNIIANFSNNSRDPRLNKGSQSIFARKIGSERSRSIYSNENGESGISENFYTIVLQWNPSWFQTQRLTGKLPPICPSFENVKCVYNNEIEYYYTYSRLHLLNIWLQMDQASNLTSDYVCEVDVSDICKISGRDCTVKCFFLRQNPTDLSSLKSEDIILCKSDNYTEFFGRVTNVTIKNCENLPSHNGNLQIIRFDIKCLEPLEKFVKKIKIKILYKNIRLAGQQNRALRCLNKDMKSLIINPQSNDNNVDIVKNGPNLNGRNMKLFRDRIINSIKCVTTRVTLVDITFPYDIVSLISMVAFQLMKDKYRVIVCLKTEETFNGVAMRLKPYEPVFAVSQKEFPNLTDEVLLKLIHSNCLQKEKLVDIDKECPITLTLVSALDLNDDYQAFVKQKKTVCIFGEAHLCSEIEYVLPMQFSKNVIMIGNTTAYVPNMSPILSSYGFHISLFYRLYAMVCKKR